MTALRRRGLHSVILGEWRVLQNIGMVHPTRCTVYIYIYSWQAIGRRRFTFVLYSSNSQLSSAQVLVAVRRRKAPNVPTHCFHAFVPPSINLCYGRDSTRWLRPPSSGGPCTSCNYQLPHVLRSLSTTTNAMGSAHIKYSLFVLLLL